MCDVKVFKFLKIHHIIILSLVCEWCVGAGTKQCSCCPLNTCTFTIPPPRCSVEMAPECTFGCTQTAPVGAFIPTTMWLSWHFVCDRPPQPCSAAPIFSDLGLATKTLGRKQENVIDAFLWSYFPPPPNGWLQTTFSCLSNLGIIVPSVHTWWRTYVPAVILGWIYNSPVRKANVFPSSKKADVFMLLCLLRFVCVAQYKSVLNMSTT